MKFIILFFSSLLFLASCSSSEKESPSEEATTKIAKDSLKIVSLNGAISEILCLYGLEDEIVGVDVSSNYPASLQHKPKVGHNRNISTEGILALSPTMVLGIKNEVNPTVIEALQNVGARVILFDFEFSPEGSYQLAQAVKDSLNLSVSSEKIKGEIEQPLSEIKPFDIKPKVLFIYARGTGTMLVSGKKTPLESMIELAGAQNAIRDFEEFKPLTPEALAAANPDVLLLFSSGLESIDGNEGLLQIPGIQQTTAGKNKAIITMDGQYLSGFGPRVGEAALELNQQLHTRINE